MATSTAAQEVDKKFLYGKFQAAEDKRARFVERVAHKAADMAIEDDVNIQNTKTGIGTGGAIGIAAAAGLPGLVAAAILGHGLLNKPQIITQPAPPAASQPVEQKFDVLFFDKDGNKIDVPRKTP